MQKNNLFFFLILFIFILLIFPLEIFADQSGNYDYKDKQELFVTADNLKIRQNPDRNSKILAVLPEGSRVICLNRRTTSLYTFNLRGRDIKAPWLYIEAGNKIRGWVFGGGIDAGKISPENKQRDSGKDQSVLKGKFGERYNISGYVFQDKIWIIGGSRDGSGFNLRSDIWNSSDGLKWELISEALPFGQRCSYGSAVFDDKMWLIGGFTDNRVYAADVWCSKDGINWKRSVKKAPFGPRVNQCLVSFRNSLWLIAGGSDDGVTENDIWRSSNGEDWYKIGAAPFSKRCGSASVVYHDKIWIIGGISWGSGGGVKNDVWNSPDGTNWVLAADKAPFSPRYLASIAVYDDKMWLIGGNTDRHMCNDLWFSSDGIHWTLADQKNPYTARDAAAAAAFNGCIIMIGGWTGSKALNDIWRFQK